MISRDHVAQLLNGGSACANNTLGELKMQKTLLLALVALVGMAFVGAAKAQEAACSTPGSITFTGLAERRADIVPSVHRQLSGLGRLAATNNCSVVITCAADPANGKDANSIRNRQCSAARQAMGMFERRGGAIRSKITSAYEVKRVGAGKGILNGAVVVTLH
jgi:hypothetical protein